MLVLSRKKNEQIVIEIDNRTIRVRIVEVNGNKVRLGIEAPNDIAVHREEVWRRLAEFAEEADTPIVTKDSLLPG